MVSNILQRQRLEKAKLGKQKENSFVCVQVLLPCQPIGVMSSAVSLTNHPFTGQF